MDNGGPRKPRPIAMERGLTVAATVALLVAMASCSADRDEPAASGSPTPSSPVPRATTSTPQSESEKASEAAAAILREFFAAVDLVRQDPSVPPSELDAVASSTQLVAQQNLLKSQRAGGLRQIGDTEVVEVIVESISLDSPATALIDLCWDVRGVDIVDSSGKSVVSPERKDVGWTRYTVTNDEWDSAPEEGWRVSGGADLEEEPCAGS